MNFTRLRDFVKNNQKEKAEAMNMTQSAVSQFASGKTSMTIDRLYLLCKKYNISADYLLGLTEDT